MGRTVQRLRRMLSIIAVGLLSLGLTGCYTQLQTVEPAPPSAKKSPAQAKKAPETNGSEYAREYRREYRTDEYADDYYGDYGEYNGSFVDDYLYEYKYQYQYKYKYGAPDRYSSRYGRCDDAFFHDPWYYDSWCGPSYGSRFSLSFHFGSPYYHHRPWRPFYSSYHHGYGGWGYSSPYANYYVGNNFIYYGDVKKRRDDREYRPRSGAIGRGATSASATTRRAADRSVRSSPKRTIHSSSSGGRIGRSTRSATVRRPAERSSVDRTRRGDRVRSSDDDRTRGRVGRSARRSPDRARTTRDRRSTRPDRSARTSGSRTNDRSRANRSRQESDRRSSRAEDRRRARDDNSEDDGGRLYRIPSVDPSDTLDRGAWRDDVRRLTPQRAPFSERPSLNRRSDRDRSSFRDRNVRSTQQRSRSRVRSTERRSSSRARSSRSQSRSDANRSQRRSSRSDRNNDSDDGGSR